MVWKTNIFVEDSPITLEGFLSDVFGWFDDFSVRAYFKDRRDVFKIGIYLDRKHFPKHIIFANFQCLRCGLCCKNYDCIQIAEDLVFKWQIEGRADILRHVDVEISEIWSKSWTGCPFCRKVRAKPYYECKINLDKEFIPVCKKYLCSKSVPVAHINFKDVDELIRIIGLDGHYALIERDWGEDFDYSKAEYKTH